MFMGTAYNSIDEKNRMIVPSKLRAGLGTRCILTKGLDKCLYIYTTADWEVQMEKISRLPRIRPKSQSFYKAFLRQRCRVRIRQARQNSDTSGT